MDHAIGSSRDLLKFVTNESSKTFLLPADPSSVFLPSCSGKEEFFLWHTQAASTTTRMIRTTNRTAPMTLMMMVSTVKFTRAAPDGGLSSDSSVTTKGGGVGSRIVEVIYEPFQLGEVHPCCFSPLHTAAFFILILSCTLSATSQVLATIT